ncbi:MAG: helix-turn-helix domain-containing protein [Candidatus Pacearchaeota archaeon]|nr:helix-turn-helix domain-containing protein [Candidatus Pacearchaeota archaeon]
MDLIEGYEELGLTKNESRAYETLVQFGALSAGDVSKRSGVPYSRIYDVLDSLVHKGIVSVVPEKTKKFVASNPENFFKLINEKEEKLKKIKEHIEKMKDFYEDTYKNPVEVVLGKRGFHKIVGEMPHSKKYSYTVKWSSEVRPEWIGDTERALKRGVDLKTLVRYDEETKKNVLSWLKVNKNYRKIENDGIAMSIIDGEQTMISLIKSNVTLLIKDKAFSKLMSKLFIETYKNSERIKK